MISSNFNQIRIFISSYVPLSFVNISFFLSKLKTVKMMALLGGSLIFQKRFSKLLAATKDGIWSPHCELGGGLAQWLASRNMDQGVPGSRPGRVAVCCGLEQVTFTPCLVLVKPRKLWMYY